MICVPPGNGNQLSWFSWLSHGDTAVYIETLVYSLAPLEWFPMFLSGSQCFSVVLSGSQWFSVVLSGS